MLSQKQGFEKKIAEMKMEQVEGFKSIFFYTALGVIAFSVVAYYYFRGQGLLLPEIGKRLIFAFIILIVIAGVLFTPKGFYIKLKDKWDNVLDFLVGKK